MCKLQPVVTTVGALALAPAVHCRGLPIYKTTRPDTPCPFLTPVSNIATMTRNLTTDLLKVCGSYVPSVAAAWWAFCIQDGAAKVSRSHCFHGRTKRAASQLNSHSVARRPLQSFTSAAAFPGPNAVKQWIITSRASPPDIHRLNQVSTKPTSCHSYDSKTCTHP